MGQNGLVLLRSQLNRMDAWYQALCRGTVYLTTPVALLCHGTVTCVSWHTVICVAMPWSTTKLQKVPNAPGGEYVEAQRDVFTSQGGRPSPVSCHGR